MPHSPLFEPISLRVLRLKHRASWPRSPACARRGPAMCRMSRRHLLRPARQRRGPIITEVTDMSSRRAVRFLRQRGRAALIMHVNAGYSCHRRTTHCTRPLFRMPARMLNSK